MGIRRVSFQKELPRFRYLALSDSAEPQHKLQKLRFYSNATLSFMAAHATNLPAINK